MANQGMVVAIVVAIGGVGCSVKDVLFQAGSDAAVPSDAAEADAADRCAVIPGMTARFHHSAIRLENGDVLVAGGMVGMSSYTNSAEIYEAAQNRWCAAGALAVARASAPIVRLRDGRILLAGGVGRDCIRSAEIFDPATRLWTTTKSEMPTGYSDRLMKNGQIALLPDGRVLLAGGVTPCAANYNRATTIYDPATDRWAAGPSINFGRWGSTLVPLRDGRIFMSLGLGSGTPAATVAEVYDPATSMWSLTPDATNIGMGTRESAAVRMRDGRIYVFGGDNGGCGSLGSGFFDPTTNRWVAGPNAMSCFIGNPYVITPDDRIIAFGGTTGSTSRAVSIYRPAIGNWMVAQPSKVSLFGQEATLLPDERVLLSGGTVDGDTPSANVEIYSPSP